MPVTLGDIGRKARDTLVVGTCSRWHSREHLAQSCNSAPPDVDLSEEQVGEHANQRQHPDNHDPRDSRRRVTMRSQQDSHDDRELEQCDDHDGDQRMLDRGEHTSTRTISSPA